MTSDLPLTPVIQTSSETAQPATSRCLGVARFMKSAWAVVKVEVRFFTLDEATTSAINTEA